MKNTIKENITSIYNENGCTSVEFYTIRVSGGSICSDNLRLVEGMTVEDVTSQEIKNMIVADEEYYNMNICNNKPYYFCDIYNNGDKVLVVILEDNNE